jgi:hypothetical protein
MMRYCLEILLRSLFVVITEIHRSKRSQFNLTAISNSLTADFLAGLLSDWLDPHLIIQCTIPLVELPFKIIRFLGIISHQEGLAALKLIVPDLLHEPPVKPRLDLCGPQRRPLLRMLKMQQRSLLFQFEFQLNHCVIIYALFVF